MKIRLWLVGVLAALALMAFLGPGCAVDLGPTQMTIPELFAQLHTAMVAGDADTAAGTLASEANVTWADGTTFTSATQFWDFLNDCFGPQQVGFDHFDFNNISVTGSSRFATATADLYIEGSDRSGLYAGTCGVKAELSQVSGSWLFTKLEFEPANVGSSPKGLELSTLSSSTPPWARKFLLRAR